MLSNGTFVILEGAYSLRPEVLESLLYLWRFTGNPRYRHWGRTIFMAIQKFCKVRFGQRRLALLGE